MIKKVILTPFQKFVKIESLSGLLLLGATIIALIWANSSLGDLYQSIWKFKIGITTEYFSLNKPLILWINDGLMAVFFFLIGLEIKRELMIGELNSMKKISFPLVGALGGMLIPVLFFLILNQNPETKVGWGIPMATDIAFCLAILKALGNRIPLSLKIFLTAFAIVDDIGAVLVIALFYSGSIKVSFLIIALVLLSILYLLSYKGFYSKFLLIFFGIIIWVLFLKSGLHPTIAGILLAFSVPVRQRIKTRIFIDNLFDIANKIKGAAVLDKPILSNEQIKQIDDLEDWTNKFQSPLQHLEHSLHDWVAYFVVPIFALANAGVILTSNMVLDMELVRNITICLVLGKGIGISSLVFFAKRLKIIELPGDITKWHIVGVSFLAGVGFTMSIFVGNLAFSENLMFIDSAKIGILTGSLISAVIGYLILRVSTKKLKETDHSS